MWHVKSRGEDDGRGGGGGGGGGGGRGGGRKEEGKKVRLEDFFLPSSSLQMPPALFFIIEPPPPPSKSLLLLLSSKFGGNPSKKKIFSFPSGASKSGEVQWNFEQHFTPCSYNNRLWWWSPNHQRWHVKWKLSRNTYTLHARFLHARRRLACSVDALLTKFLHRSSEGSLLTLCWLLGRGKVRHALKMFTLRFQRM